MAEIPMTSVLMTRLLGLKSPQAGGVPVSSVAGGDKSSATSQNAAAVLSADQTTLFVTSLNKTSQNLQTVFDALGRSLTTLQGARDAANNVIGILEEAGGITVRARDTLRTSAGYEGNKDRLAELEDRYSAVLKKLDGAVDKASAQGVNLLKADTLTTVFDAEGKSTLVTQGFDVTAKGLEMRAPKFSSLESVQDSRIDVMNAIDIATTLRNQISSDVMLLQTRQEFSENAIAAMASGSEHIQQNNLTDEAANLLALQIRQQLSETESPPCFRGTKSFVATIFIAGVWC
jgi:flagellin